MRSLPLALLLPSLALAQPAPPPAPAAPGAPSPPAVESLVAPRESASEQLAKRHFSQGVALFNDGNFVAALVEFEASFKERAVPAVLFNIALTYKALYRYAEATSTVERYLLEGAASIPEERRQEAEALLIEWRHLLGHLAIVAEPPESTIILDGKAVLNGAYTRVDPGPHVVTVSAPGAETDKRTISLAAGQKHSVIVRLKTKITEGQVTFDVEPRASLIFIDGEERGRGEVDTTLTAGAHKLEITSPGYLPHRDAFTLAAGERRDFHVVLKKWELGIHKRWWFWTGLVALAGGVTFGTLCATHAFGVCVGEPYEGTLIPGLFQVGK